MNIAELTLENFGTYAGINRVNLTPEEERPVILVGGTNGAGKTTILESLLLCLHGRRAFGTPLSLREYHDSMRSRFHAPAEGAWRPSECAVAVQFTLAEDGVTQRFDVERRWRRSSKGAIGETLSLQRDGRDIDDLPESAWQDFLDGLVPPGLAGLFFFDGERIQALAEDDSGTRLQEAVRRLLGLDVIEQLQLDLTRLISGQNDASLDTAEREAVERQKDVQLAIERMASVRDQQQALAARRQDLADTAGRVREDFARRGGELALDRDRLQEAHRKACEKAAVGEAKVRESAAGLLPFALSPEIAKAVSSRLEQEREAEIAKIVDQRLAEAEAELTSRLPSRKGLDVVAAIREVLVGTDLDPEASRVHDLTASERAVLAHQLVQVRTEVPEAARKLARQLRRAEEDRARTRELLDKAPEESDVSDLLAQVQAHERELAALDVELRDLDDALRQAAYEHKVAERERRRAMEALREVAGRVDRNSRAVRALAVLAEFEQRVQTEKLGRIEVEAARFFNRLSRKGSLLSHISIDPASFRVELKRWDETELPRERLSAGEKQLLAISLLWALAKVSGRPLPVVVDTPLARLDKVHRERLLEEYFPNVSHQVVVLSTDTEVDHDAAAALGPHVARSYRLQHDAETCCTSVHDGYFIAPEAAANAR